VQTPTLAILVEREEKIKKFVSRDYWEIHGTFAAQAGEYPGRWFDEKFSKKMRTTNSSPNASGREVREAIATMSRQTGIVTRRANPRLRFPPLLYDLTACSARRTGVSVFSARTRSVWRRRFYERHKVLTYPRTDSRALPEDYVETVKKTLGMLRTRLQRFRGRQILKSGLGAPETSAFFNNGNKSRVIAKLSRV